MEVRAAFPVIDVSAAEKWVLFCAALDEGRISVILENATATIDGGIIATQLDEVLEVLSDTGRHGGADGWNALVDACQEERICFILEGADSSIDGGVIVTDADDMFDHINIPAFTVEERALTPKTAVHDVRLGPVTVATCGKPDAARNIAKFFGEHRVRTVDDFKKLPNPVRVAFISATGQDLPHLPRSDNGLRSVPSRTARKSPR